MGDNQAAQKPLNSKNIIRDNRVEGHGCIAQKLREPRAKTSKHLFPTKPDRADIKSHKDTGVSATVTVMPCTQKHFTNCRRTRLTRWDTFSCSNWLLVCSQSENTAGATRELRNYLNNYSPIDTGWGHQVCSMHVAKTAWSTMFSWALTWLSCFPELTLQKKEISELCLQEINWRSTARDLPWFPYFISFSLWHQLHVTLITVIIVCVTVLILSVFAAWHAGLWGSKHVPDARHSLEGYHELPRRWSGNFWLQASPLRVIAVCQACKAETQSIIEAALQTQSTWN